MAGSAGMGGYAGASPIHPLGTNAVSTTKGSFPASIAGARQYACASMPPAEIPASDEAPMTALPTEPDDPDALSLVAEAAPLVPAALLTPFERVAPASKPWEARPPHAVGFTATSETVRTASTRRTLRRIIQPIFPQCRRSPSPFRGAPSQAYRGSSREDRADDTNSITEVVLGRGSPFAVLGL